MQIKSYAKTLIPAAIVLVVASLNGAGPLLGLLLAVFIVWALYSAARMGVKPAERRDRGARLVIWAVALGIALAVQAYWTAASRSAAETAAAALRDHRSRTGAYPASLADTGLDEQALRGEWGLRYLFRNGRPELS